MGDLGRRKAAFLLDTIREAASVDALHHEVQQIVASGGRQVTEQHREEAARAYRVMLGMWEHGDPEVQPQVQRAREAHARLGG